LGRKGKKEGRKEGRTTFGFLGLTQAEGLGYWHKKAGSPRNIMAIQKANLERKTQRAFGKPKNPCFLVQQAAKLPVAQSYALG